MSVIKKITACMIAAAMLMLMLASCGKSTTWSAVIDGYEVRAGIFIIYQSQAYDSAFSHIPEDMLEQGLPENFDILSITIDGKSATQWINDEAVRYMQEFVAIEQKFDELGLVMSDLEVQRVNNQVDSTWESYDEYAMYMGVQDLKPRGVGFEKRGISKQSMADVILNDLKRAEIFDYYYGAEGVNAVSQEEINQYIVENSALVNIIEIPLKDGEGNLLKSDEKAERIAMADDYLERALAGEPMSHLIEEFDAFYSALIQAAQPAQDDFMFDFESEVEDPTEESTEEPETQEGEESEEVAEEVSEVETDEETEETSEEISDEEAEIIGEDLDSDEPSDDELDSDDHDEYDDHSGHDHDYRSIIINKTDGYLPLEVTDYVFGGAMNIGDIRLFEFDEVCYVVELLDILGREDYIEQVDQSVRFILKGEEFEEMIISWTQGQNVILNEAALTRYKPKSLREY